MTSPKPMTYAVSGVAAVALAFGAYAVGNSNSGASSAAAAGGRPPGMGGMAQNGQPPPGFGTPATGAAAAKAKAAALAKYKGTAERVMKLADGSYVVHVVTSGGDEYHVTVTKGFEVTGARQGGGPGGPGGPGSGGMPGGASPSGSIPASPPSSATN